MTGDKVENVNDSNDVPAVVSSLIDWIVEQVQRLRGANDLSPLSMVCLEMKDDPACIRMIGSGGRIIERYKPKLAQVIMERIRQLAAMFQEHFQIITCIEIDPKFGVMTVRGDKRVAGF